MLIKLISGGQTGADYISLEVAEELGIPTGGTAPKGWRTENGPNPELGTRFGLVESYSVDYMPRTRDNVRDSAGTVIFDYHNSGGSIQTKNICVRLGRPYIINPDETALVQWLIGNNIDILNGAGNRGSKLSVFEKQNIRHILRVALAYARVN